MFSSRHFMLPFLLLGSFHTSLPLREAFIFYNKKHGLSHRKHIQISFNEIRHILNMAQIMAMRAPILKQEGAAVKPEDDTSKDNDDDSLVTSDISGDGKAPFPFNGPKLITFDGDQTLYSDGSNFEGNPQLAGYLYSLIKQGVNIAVVTAAGYEYNVEKYEFRLSGLLNYFKSKGLTAEECDRFYLFGGECNYLLKVSEFATRKRKEIDEYPQHFALARIGLSTPTCKRTWTGWLVYCNSSSFGSPCQLGRRRRQFAP